MELTSFWQAPGQSVSIAVWDDGVIQVIADQDFTSGDWGAACVELERLPAGPLGLPEAEGEFDIYATSVRLPAAA